MELSLPMPADRLRMSAERLVRSTIVLGRENVMSGVDCGFGINARPEMEPSTCYPSRRRIRTRRAVMTMNFPMACASTILQTVCKRTRRSWMVSSSIRNSTTP